MKKKLGLLALLALSVAFVSCGKKEEAKPAEAPKTEAAKPAETKKEEPKKEEVKKEEAKPAETAAATSGVAEYKEAINKVLGKINDASKGIQNINQADPKTALPALKKAIDEISPLYKELADLKAPDSLAGAQTKIKDGAEASVELLKTSSEMLEMTSDPAKAAQAMSKIQELQKKMPELQKKAQDMQAAFTEIQNAK